jgi:antibiotic biosynthesis monooxygenase (ABM) superfamily enzyme
VDDFLKGVGAQCRLCVVNRSRLFGLNFYFDSGGKPGQPAAFMPALISKADLGVTVLIFTAMWAQNSHFYLPMVCVSGSPSPRHQTIGAF